MTATSIKENLIAQIDKLPYDLQLRVLGFAKALIPKGVEGKSLLKFKRAIPLDDLQLMSKAIEENCKCFLGTPYLTPFEFKMPSELAIYQ